MKVLLYFHISKSLYAVLEYFYLVVLFYLSKKSEYFFHIVSNNY